MPVFFDGINDNLMTVQDAASTAIDRNITTVAGFVIQSNQPTDQQVAFLVSNAQSPNGTIFKGMNTDVPTTSGFRFRFHHRWTDKAMSWRSNSDFSTQTWYQFVATYDASLTTNDPTMYVNNASVGIVQVGTNPTGTRSSGFDTAICGISEGSLANYLNGTLAFLCLESAIWTAAQINRHYWYGTPGGSVDLVYPILTSDYSNKGTVSNAPLVANNGPITVSSLTNAHKGFVLLRSCT